MRPRRSALTVREVEIAALVEQGLRNRDIARAARNPDGHRQEST